MFFSIDKPSLFILVILMVTLFQEIYCNPQLEILGGYDIIGVCIRNCAQCQTMLGKYFNGQLCAESCMNFKGKMIPDCENVQSIAPFLKLE